MQTVRSQVCGFLLVVSAGVTGCAPGPAYGPSGEDRLAAAVAESQAEKPNRLKEVTKEQVDQKHCKNFRDKLAPAKNDEVKEEDRLEAYMATYKELKSNNEFLDAALATNPDLQFANESQVPKIREECVSALAEVRSDYYAFLSDVTDLLVVTDVNGKPAPRLDFAKLKEAITVLGNDDREQMLGKVDAADRRVKGAAGSPAPAAK